MSGEKMKKVWIIMLIIMESLMSYGATNYGYQMPSQDIVELYDAPKAPYYSVLQRRNMALEISYYSHQTLQDLAEPKLQLAGKTISPRLNAERETSPITAITLHDLTTNQKRQVPLPAGCRVRDYDFSPDYSRCLIKYEAPDGVRLMVLNVKKNTIKYYDDVVLNDVFSSESAQWFNDNRRLLLFCIPADRGEAPGNDGLPTSPVIEESAGKTSTLRTYTNLLTNPHDEALFDYYYTSQLQVLDVKSGRLTPLGEPAVYYTSMLSPDNSLIHLSILHRPYSYQVPYYYFPRRFELWDTRGHLVKELHQRPLQDQIPMGGTYVGPRYYDWQPGYPARLVWKDALDNGDPKVKVPHRDRIMVWDAPFDAPPVELIRLEHRYSKLWWSSEKDEFIVREYDRDRLWRRDWLHPADAEPRLLFDMSTNDEYNDPGDLVMVRDADDQSVFLKQDGAIFYRNNTGATKDGNFPFLAAYDLDADSLRYLYRSGSEFFDRVSGFVDPQLNTLLIRRESKTTPRNYLLYHLDTQRWEPLTDYPNPYPQLTDLRTELVTYPRADGIPLSGVLYYPTDYQPGKRYPLIINAYPDEYTDAATASQVTRSDNRFPLFWGSSFKYLALKGYMVLAHASIPIVGDPQTVNESFIEQTLGSVEAAINYLDDSGLIDRQKVGIVGHSYGAFMVATVLAHSELCSCGIARSGAYNRTLTPFGFQSERRTFWQAPDFYIQASPFVHADKINEPILLIHGIDDDNSGTYPMQSQRFYQALKGNGGTARLVMLPLEGHGYTARESNLHVLAEMIDWFDRYLK
jgi:dipeptidyl aminopeptidase/acylaminoacyl peptidase